MDSILLIIFRSRNSMADQHKKYQSKIRSIRSTDIHMVLILEKR